MKIYCRRFLHNKSDKEIFDNLAGENAWIKTKCSTVGGDDMIQWINVLEKAYYSDGTPCYKVLSADTLINSKSKLWVRSTPIYYELAELQGDIVHPIEVLTEEELSEIYNIIMR